MNSDSVFVDSAFSMNLAAFSGEFDACADIVRGQLGELAICAVCGLISEYGGGDELKAAFVAGTRLREYFDAAAVNAPPEPERAAGRKSVFGGIKALMLAAYCRLAVRAYGRLANAADLLSLSDFTSGDADADINGKNTVVYFKNTLSDEAFAGFSRILPGLSSEASPSFAASCEEVYDGGCRYAILPVFSGTDGQLSGFYRLIDKYDLKINAETEVQHDDSSTTFALLGRGIYSANLGSRAAVRLEISACLPDSLSLSDFLGAAAALGAAAVRVNASPLTYDPSSFAYSVCFSANADGLIPVLLYLNAAVPDRALIGIY